MRRLVSRPEVERPEAGSTFGGYEIEGALDEQTGAGRVYVARASDGHNLDDHAPWLPLALKVIGGRFIRQRSFDRAFTDAADRQAGLRDPHVVTVFEVGTSPAPFIAMTLVQGPTLAELIESRQLDEDSLVTIVHRVAAGLEAGREHGLTYRRLRPRGVLVPGGDPERAVLGDFGAGRPADVEADTAANVRALGAILSEGLAHTEVRPELQAVIAQALAEDPAKRQGSPAELADAVDLARPRKRRARSRGERHERVRRVPIATPAMAFLIAGAAALGAIAAPGNEDRTAQARPLSSGAISLQYPANWRHAAEVPAVAGLTFREPVAIAPPAGRGPGTLTAGHVGTGALPGGKREPVELDAVQAYRYTGLPAGDGREANLYVVPTESDAVAVSCVAPPGSDRFMADCERVASTLRLDGESAVALAPSPRYAGRLSGLVTRLDRARRSGRSALRSAGTRRVQAAAAEKLSNAYRAASKSAAALTPPPGARDVHTQIEQALASVAQGYRTMAVAGRASNADGWVSGRKVAMTGEQALQTAIRGLAELGYKPAT
jgi:hypothetical protein